ncbi:MAG: zincin-like metallopeptidase domain-containing protein [Alphaproteobacteria bacterium]|nr:zincin-like metallopeptidase domain-containing protein [Alphaproteobacteria bacterium]
MEQTNKFNIYSHVTDKIIADLEKGVRPWQKPWNSAHTSGRIVRPRRHNGLPYNGVNILLLWSEAYDKGYQSPTWMTFRQAQEYGGHIRKGEKSCTVVYASTFSKAETDETTGQDIEKDIPFLRGYRVFNAEQIEGLPERFTVQPEGSSLSKPERLDLVDQFIRNTGADLRHGGDRAFYAEKADYIRMPRIEAFKDPESYYGTLTHELTHWTKHKSRLDRTFATDSNAPRSFGDESYAKEELVAEIGSAFLCADLGITPDVREDHAAYIGHWLKALKDDRKLIFSAAAHAGRAADYLKDLQSKVTCTPTLPTTTVQPSLSTTTPAQH